VTAYRWPLFVYPSRLCNYRCSYCFTESAPEQPHETYLVSHWHELIGQAAALGVPEIRISGGEPLALPGIEAMCRDVVEHSMSYTITTNAALIARHVTWLRALPPETLWLSFHREYCSAEAFVTVVRLAAEVLPRVGLNVFAGDYLPAFATSGAHRIKLLAQTPVGRAQEAIDWPTRTLDAPPGVEVRIESPHREPGAGGCVLKERPLLSIDSDGRAYACCVTVGGPGAEVGDLRIESLASVVSRTLSPPPTLPCAGVLPGVLAGEYGCPVRLYSSA